MKTLQEFRLERQKELKEATDFRSNAPIGTRFIQRYGHSFIVFEIVNRNGEFTKLKPIASFDTCLEVTKYNDLPLLES